MKKKNLKQSKYKKPNRPSKPIITKPKRSLGLNYHPNKPKRWPPLCLPHVTRIQNIIDSVNPDLVNLLEALKKLPNECQPGSTPIKPKRSNDQVLMMNPITGGHLGKRNLEQDIRSGLLQRIQVPQDRDRGTCQNRCNSGPYHQAPGYDPNQPCQCNDGNTAFEIGDNNVFYQWGDFEPCSDIAEWCGPQGNDRGEGDQWRWDDRSWATSDDYAPRYTEGLRQKEAMEGLVTCPAGEIPNCRPDRGPLCVPAAYLGDEYCDHQGQPRSADLCCYQIVNSMIDERGDMGDCEGDPDATCKWGERDDVGPWPQ